VYIKHTHLGLIIGEFASLVGVNRSSLEPKLDSAKDFSVLVYLRFCLKEVAMRLLLIVCLFTTTSLFAQTSGEIAEYYIYDFSMLEGRDNYSLMAEQEFQRNLASTTELMTSINFMGNLVYGSLPVFLNLSVDNINLGGVSLGLTGSFNTDANNLNHIDSAGNGSTFKVKNGGTNSYASFYDNKTSEIAYWGSRGFEVRLNYKNLLWGTVAYEDRNLLEQAPNSVLSQLSTELLRSTLNVYMPDLLPDFPLNYKYILPKYISFQWAQGIEKSRDMITALQFDGWIHSIIIGHSFVLDRTFTNITVQDPWGFSGGQINLIGEDPWLRKIDYGFDILALIPSLSTFREKNQMQFLLGITLVQASAREVSWFGANQQSIQPYASMRILSQEYAKKGAPFGATAYSLGGMLTAFGNNKTEEDLAPLIIYGGDIFFAF